MLPHYYLAETMGGVLFSFTPMLFLFIPKWSSPTHILVCICVYVLVGCHVNKGESFLRCACVCAWNGNTHKLIWICSPALKSMLWFFVLLFFNTFYLLLIMQFHLISFWVALFTLWLSLQIFFISFGSIPPVYGYQRVYLYCSLSIFAVQFINGNLLAFHLY